MTKSAKRFPKTSQRNLPLRYFLMHEYIDMRPSVFMGPTWIHCLILLLRSVRFENAGAVTAAAAAAAGRTQRVGCCSSTMRRRRKSWRRASVPSGFAPHQTQRQQSEVVMSENEGMSGEDEAKFSTLRQRTD